jgi:hypothetical protein
MEKLYNEEEDGGANRDRNGVRKKNRSRYNKYNKIKGE